LTRPARAECPLPATADALVRVLLAKCDAIDREHDVAAHDHLLTSDDRGQVAAAQAEAFRRRAVRDALHEQSGMCKGHIEYARHLVGEQIAFQAAPHARLRKQRAAGHVRGDDEAESVRAPGAGHDAAHDADHLAGEVEHRSA